MANSIDGIVNMSISLESPAVSSASYSGGLIVGMPPVKKGTTVKGFEKYSSLSGLTEAGYASTDPVYKAAMVWFSQDPQPTELYVATTLATTEEGGTYEEPVVAIQRAHIYSGWYGVLPAGIDHEKYAAIADYIETTEKICVFTLDHGEELAFIKKSYNRTFIERLASDQTDEADKFQHVAQTAKCFSYSPGEETWAFKSLSGITAGIFTDSQVAAMDKAHENYFVEIAGSKITQGGAMLSGEWIDVIRFRDWLKNDMQMRVFNLFVMLPKVAYTDQGIGLIENAMKASLRQGQTLGGIAEDSFDGNGTKISGWTTSVPLAASLSQEQKKNRKLPGCVFTARLAGAIHAAEIKGTLGY
ncbi:MAG: DUF3383 family protein [Lachnospiraceae bacterium]